MKRLLQREPRLSVPAVWAGEFGRANSQRRLSRARHYDYVRSILTDGPPGSRFFIAYKSFCA
jgi:hypothetical protein